MPRFNRTKSWRKGDGSLVSDADLSSSAALVEQLGTLIDIPVVSEEMTQHEQLARWRSAKGNFWCIDPLDGTSNFGAGLPFFAVSIALLLGGRPVLGVVHAPAMHETFTAQRGGGAFLNEQRLPVRPAAETLGDSMAGLDFKRLPKMLALNLATERPFHSTRNLGSSALELSYLAAGRLDVYAHGSQKLWDFAAGALLIEEAGGCITTFTAADFWSQEPWQRSVIAASSKSLMASWSHWLHRHMGPGEPRRNDRTNGTAGG